MPRCEGLPTGPCPLKVNNTTVKSTTLFLCPSCDEARFPKNPTAETKNSKGNKRTSGTKSVQTRSSNENDSSDIDVCPRCFFAAERNCRLVCDTCHHTYHQKCTSMSAKVYDQFVVLMSAVGWVCDDCKDTVRSLHQQLPH